MGTDKDLNTIPDDQLEDETNPFGEGDDLDEGLTDDERISRDGDSGGATVEPGPADLERLPKT